MSVTIGGIAVENYISPPQCNTVHRSRSVKYALDGTALEDRLGNYKKSLVLTFGAMPANVWEPLKSQLKLKQISVSGNIGGVSADGTYRLIDDTIPTPIMVVINDRYYCQPFSIEMEEI